MSIPISEIIAVADLLVMPGIVESKSICSWNSEESKEIASSSCSMHLLIASKLFKQVFVLFHCSEEILPSIDFLMSSALGNSFL